MLKISALSRQARKQGFKKGDTLISYDGHPFCDVLDCLFLDAKERFSVIVERKGKEKVIDVKKAGYTSLGIEIEQELSPFRCQNKCKFCFVDQLPKGMRELLYVKDDDYRYSFISGSYVTLTNLSDEQIDRIVRLKLSPIYISVHAYDDEIRLSLVTNPKTKNLIANIKKLGNSGIEMHTQIVMVPAINDGKVLEESIRKLEKIKGVKSCAVVPVGLTKHREKLEKLNAVDAAKAVETIDLIEQLHIELDGFCWCSDEFYLIAKKQLPEFDYYGAFEQIENGVGLVADFRANFEYALSETTDCDLQTKVGLFTGVSFAPLLRDFAKTIEQKMGVKVKVLPVVNKFFGESVTVAGLVTASDIVSQTKNKNIDGYIVPSNMLKEFSDVFLDDISISQLEKQLGKKVLVAAASGNDLLEKIAEI